MPSIERLANKEISYRYHGTTLRYLLSHALFSSNSVDIGTDLLLKTLSTSEGYRDVTSILDVGCGTGVLGLAAASASGARLVGQDRDALATAFSTTNAGINGISNAVFTPGLALTGLDDQSFDLVLSNIPAKAGAGYITSFIENAPTWTTETGSVWIVIVQTLADMASSIIEEAGFEVIERRDGAGHRVIGYHGGGETHVEIPWESYTRTVSDYSYENVTYTLQTVYGLPDFDSLGFQTSMILRGVTGIARTGAMLVVDPGQGHVPAWIARHPETSGELHMASHDMLQLSVTERNCKKLGKTVTSHTIATYADLTSSVSPPAFDLICGPYEPIPTIPQEPDFLSAMENILRPGGSLVVNAKSTYAARLLKHAKKFTLTVSKKHKGYRTLVLEKK